MGLFVPPKNVSMSFFIHFRSFPVNQPLNENSIEFLEFFLTPSLTLRIIGTFIILSVFLSNPGSGQWRLIKSLILWYWTSLISFYQVSQEYLKQDLDKSDSCLKSVSCEGKCMQCNELLPAKCLWLMLNIRSFSPLIIFLFITNSWPCFCFTQ